MGCWRNFGLDTRLRSTHCREFNYLKLCRPAYFVITYYLRYTDRLSVRIRVFWSDQDPGWKAEIWILILFLSEGSDPGLARTRIIIYFNFYWPKLYVVRWVFTKHISVDMHDDFFRDSGFPLIRFDPVPVFYPGSKTLPLFKVYIYIYKLCTNFIFSMIKLKPVKREVNKKKIIR